ncbi:hypothetical protein AB4348_18810, partial [Vibrio breoganii]
ASSSTPSHECRSYYLKSGATTPFLFIGIKRKTAFSENGSFKYKSYIDIAKKLQTFDIIIYIALGYIVLLPKMLVLFKGF